MGENDSELNVGMIENVSVWIDCLFILTFFGTLLLFYFANNKPKLVTLLILIWSIIHSILAYNGFYQITNTVPPRFALVLIPNSLLIIYALTSTRKTRMLENRNLTISTLLHSIRIPVEIALLYLYFAKMIPELMTFEGRNFDILAGISAPIVALLYLKGKLSKRTLLYWNILGLILVSIILANGILSAELPFQQFAFDQPNKALNYFPYILLPATVVPIVIYTHISDIIKLSTEMKSVVKNYS